MDAYNFFLNKDGHLRSGWRLAIFAVAFLICVQVTQIALFLGLSAVLRRSHNELINGYWSRLPIQRSLHKRFKSALIVTAVGVS